MNKSELCAKTVVSFFLPLSEEIRRSNRTEKDIPYEESIPQRSSAEWLHGRIEGHGGEVWKCYH